VEFLTVLGKEKKSSGMRCHIYWQIWADISEIRATCTFRVEEKVIWGNTGHYKKGRKRHSHVFANPPTYYPNFLMVSFLSEDGENMTLQKLVNFFCDVHCLLFLYLS